MKINIPSLQLTILRLISLKKIMNINRLLTIEVLPSSKRFLGLKTGLESFCYGFLRRSKNMNIKLTGVSKLPLGVSVSVDGWLPCSSPRFPTMDWRPGCTLPLAGCLLEMGSRDQSRINGIDNGWCQPFCLGSPPKKIVFPADLIHRQASFPHAFSSWWVMRNLFSCQHHFTF